MMAGKSAHLWEKPIECLWVQNSLKSTGMTGMDGVSVQRLSQLQSPRLLLIRS